MPRSRSWSIESMTRSATSSRSCAEKTPDWRSIASTSVVLPWSTCAMIATLRMSVRRAKAALQARSALCGDRGDRHVQALELAREIELEPARDALGQRRDDDLVEAVDVDGVVDR